MALGGGLFLFRQGSSSSEVEIIASGEETDKAEIVVHVDGAVGKPGVYRLASGARVTDAVAAAGGLMSQADGSRINLAAKVADGQKVYIPRVGESVGQSTGGSVSQIAGESVDQLININTASETELDKLPGVGPVTAGKIIASRPYSALEDLLTKKVIYQISIRQNQRIDNPINSKCKIQNSKLLWRTSFAFIL